jgi:peroxiredoxin (alkyl hydroperoxide reductase subunit C)
MENTENIVKEEQKRPELGKKAPYFKANTTHGVKSIDDFKGKWLIFFSHPADFTPVCTTEFVSFQEHYPEFQKRKTELLGLSIDSIFSHIAWTRNIKEKLNVEIQFPILEDLSMQVARSYGMIHENMGETQAVRSVFFIDPNGILRAMVYYPMSMGRNMSEFVRMIDALQESDKNQCATPANWQKGDKVIVPPAMTTQQAEDNFNNNDYEVTDWYLCKKSV